MTQPLRLITYLTPGLPLGLFADVVVPGIFARGRLSVRPTRTCAGVAPSVRQRE